MAFEGVDLTLFLLCLGASLLGGGLGFLALLRLLPPANADADRRDRDPKPASIPTSPSAASAVTAAPSYAPTGSAPQRPAPGLFDLLFGLVVLSAIAKGVSGASRPSPSKGSKRS